MLAVTANDERETQVNLSLYFLGLFFRWVRDGPNFLLAIPQDNPS